MEQAPKQSESSTEKKMDDEVKSATEIARMRADEMLNSQEEEPAQEEAAQPQSDDASASKLAEYVDHLQRLQAEFDNYRKRVERERADFVKYANANLISVLTEVLDDFDRGLHEDHLKDVPEGFLQGMEGILRKFRDTLEKQGLEKIATVGEVFDPEIHEAVFREETDAYPPGTISGEVRPGYRLGDRLLRAPLVKVAAAPANQNND